MKSSNEIGQRIKALREGLGMSKSELARRCGVTTTAVWNWEENGRVARGQTLDQAAKTLGVSQRYLISGEESDRGSTVAPSGTRTVAVIIEGARSEIANVTGIPFSNVRLNVEFISQ